jgi:hypothetical protein
MAVEACCQLLLRALQETVDSTRQLGNAARRSLRRVLHNENQHMHTNAWA